MKNLRVERLLNLGRGALLVSSALALATAAVWAWRPDWVEDFDQARVSARVDTPVALLRDIVEEEPGSPGSIGRLEAFLRDLGPVPRGDRLGDSRRLALRTLSASHEAAGDPDAALARLEELVAFDGKDLEARLARARLLHRTEGRREEARAELALLYELLSEDLRVVEAYVEALIADGEFERAVQVAAEHDQHGRSILWRLSWRPSPKAPNKQALVVPLRGADGVLRLAVTIEGPVRYLRLDLPERLAMIFEEPALTVSYADRKETLSVLDGDGRTVGLVPNGRTLATSGRSNAFFEFDLESSPKAEFTELSFESPFSWGVSPALAGLAARPELAAALAAPDSPLDPAVAARLRKVGLRKAVATPLEVFWSSGEESFSGKRRAQAGAEISESEQGFDFAASIPLGRTLARLRLDLPDAQGLSWDLTTLELVSETGTVSLDPAALVLIGSHSLGRAAERFVVEGLDPWLAFEVPGGPLEVGALRVTGSVQ